VRSYWKRGSPGGQKNNAEKRGKVIALRKEGGKARDLAERKGHDGRRGENVELHY